MKAMILAAGLGTRLRPLTNDRPKALVEVAGRTLLEITLMRLCTLGIREVIVNVHHFADQVIGYLAAKQNFGLRIEISREEELLDTGGGLKKAAWFFREDNPDRNQPFLLHNVDVLSTIDLTQMLRAHTGRNALATLAVQARPTSRPLLFDEQGQLRGRATGEPTPYHPQAFCGIHVVSPRIFDSLSESGAFSVIDAYIRLAAQGEKIRDFPADAFYWRDLGRPESIEKAAADLRSGLYSIESKSV